MEEYIRECPKCNGQITYKSKGAYTTAKKRDSNCKSCSRSGKNNPMYGRVGDKNPFYGRKHSEETILKMKQADKSYVKDNPSMMKNLDEGRKIRNTLGSNYQIWVKKFGVEEADKRLKISRDKVSKVMSGEGNPMYGKISPQGSGNGWKGWYNGRFFRSLRELNFIIQHPEYQSAETKDWTVEFEWRGNKRTTRADFICHTQRSLVECKPEKLIETPFVLARCEALSKLCEERGYTFSIVDSGIVDKEELISLTSCGNIVWQVKYKERVDAWRK